MMETDDKLIREFFAKQKQEIPDNGFSRRVMHHLPYRTGLLVKIWSVFITLVAVVLFFAYDGLQVLHVIYSYRWCKAEPQQALISNH